MIPADSLNWIFTFLAAGRLLLILLLFVGFIYLLIHLFMDNTPSVGAPSKAALIKTLYLYLVSFVALMMMVISAIDLISSLLKTFVFTKADSYTYYSAPIACPPVDSKSPTSSEACLKDTADRRKGDEESRTAQRQRDLVRDISMLVIALPLFVFHWKLARKRE